VQEVTGVPVDKLKAAADILGTSKMLLSTVLQGVYQSNQVTAAGVQVRGLSGKRDCGVLQMNGQPLIRWKTPEDVFNGWRECTRGRLCDYSGMTYEKLSRGSGIQWPCNEQNPDGTPRLYTDHQFPTHYEAAESFDHDLVTGAMVQPEEYKAMNPNGRAFLKSADYQPPHEQPDNDYPLMLTTGRVVYHFHTRTKTGRSQALHGAEPDAFVQVSDEDARGLGLSEGDLVAVESRRGRVHVPVRVGFMDPGEVFIPFHYGYWDDETGRPRAANELTLYEWDPVSKQPHYKYAAVRIRKLAPEEYDKALEGGREPDEALLFPSLGPTVSCRSTRRRKPPPVPITSSGT
jgi:ferredoxin-nitrate reductase